MPLPSGVTCSTSPTWVSETLEFIGLSRGSAPVGPGQEFSAVGTQVTEPPCSYKTIEFTQLYHMVLQNDFLRVLSLIYFLLSPFVSYVIASWIVEEVWTESLEEG